VVYFFGWRSFAQNLSPDLKQPPGLWVTFIHPFSTFFPKSMIVNLPIAESARFSDLSRLAVDHPICRSPDFNGPGPLVNFKLTFN
jgi:hypothetical protein